MEGRIRFLMAVTPSYAHAYQNLCLTRRPYAISLPKIPLAFSQGQIPELSKHPNHHAVFTDGGTLVSDGETTAGWGAVARSPDGRLCVMFGPVITTEAPRLHTNNTAEPSGIIEALSFLGPAGPVARGSQARFFYDSKHAAHVCMGTMQTRTDVPLALTSQQVLLPAHLRLRIAIEHVYSHGQNVSTACADHAAVLGAYGLISNQNINSRWVHSSFDSTTLFDAVEISRAFTQHENDAHACPTRPVQRLLKYLLPCFPVEFCAPLGPRFRFCCVFGSVDAYVLPPLFPCFSVKDLQ